MLCFETSRRPFFSGPKQAPSSIPMHEVIADARFHAVADECKSRLGRWLEGVLYTHLGLAKEWSGTRTVAPLHSQTIEIFTYLGRQSSDDERRMPAAYIHLSFGGPLSKWGNSMFHLAGLSLESHRVPEDDAAATQRAQLLTAASRCCMAEGRKGVSWWARRQTLSRLSRLPSRRAINLVL